MGGSVERRGEERRGEAGQSVSGSGAERQHCTSNTARQDRYHIHLSLSLSLSLVCVCVCVSAHILPPSSIRATDTTGEISTSHRDRLGCVRAPQTFFFPLACSSARSAPGTDHAKKKVSLVRDKRTPRICQGITLYTDEPNRA
ncbi:hypothetical protein AMELA_G00070020 [Ameiurus melas]|uniref:Transmembrane protein n=1 Tax=Ameiurus melas TaxID=219545 RepID=A0A7J6B6N5_AMEME|nr:hypothetical protein AMELA_G00070020 [Ameiurus melas]